MTTQPQELYLHLQWTGPHTIEEVKQFDGDTHVGLYQVYGAHPVYGTDTLLYIGLVADEPFAARFRQHEGWCKVNQDSGRLQIHIGRFIGRLSDCSTPDNATWCRYIKFAERLLIYAHQPALNTQKELASLEPDLRHVHVLNWGQYRLLLPEASGARWADRFEHITFGTYFTTKDLTQPPA